MSPISKPPHTASSSENRSDDQNNEMRAELQEMRAFTGDCEHWGGRFVVGYGIAVYEAGLRYLEQNRDLLTATEETGASRLTLNAGAAE